MLKAESVDKITDAEYNKELKKERFTKKMLIALAASLLGALLIPLLQTFSWISLTLLSTSIAGTIVGYILIAKELGVTYKSVESFCNTSTRVNCDRVLNSEGAKILSFFSLSEAVISYFVFQLIVAGIILPFAGSNESYLWVLMAGSALSSPMVIYSLYYQAVRAKTWCKLCMLVNVVLITQAVFFGFLFMDGILTIQAIEVFPFIFSALLFLAITTSVVLLKEKFHKINKAVNAEIAANRVKYDTEVFAHLLFQGQQVNTSTFDKEMIIGNPEAPIKLLMVANLHCHPCKLAFENVLELVDNFPEHVNAELRFLMSGGNLIHEIMASTYLIQYWKQHVYKKEDEHEHTKKLISDWYNRTSTQDFEKLYPKDLLIVDNEENSLELQHYKWVTEHNIKRTPTHFLNGYQFPSKYGVKDLANLMTGLEGFMPKQKKGFKRKGKELVQ
ncbi:MAG: vitamin K epoxide reductase family protein [Balneola sp.]